MEAEIMQFVQSNPASAYLAVFGVLLACGLGVPLPEDITLLAGGYTVYLSGQAGLSAPSLVPMIIVGLAGVLAGDIFLFVVGRWMGPRVTKTWPFRRLVTPSRMEKVYRYFSRYGVRTAFFARFAAGLRAPTYLLAGTAKMRFRTFILADGSAALISVPAIVWAAYHFGAQIDIVRGWIMQAKYVLLAAIGAALVIVAIRAIRRRFAARHGQSGIAKTAEKSSEHTAA